MLLGDDSVEIAHAVLLRAWKQLRAWLEDDQADLALYSQIVADAQAWDSSGRDPSYLYPRSRLDSTEAASTRWADALSRVPPLPSAGAAFLAAGRRAVRRAMVRKWGIIGAVAVLAVSALTAGGLALRNDVDTDQQHAIALSRQLAAASLAMDAGEPTTARQLAVAAFHVSPTDQARSAMAAMLAEQQQSGTMFTGTSVNGVGGVRLRRTAAGRLRLIRGDQTAESRRRPYRAVRREYL